MSLRYLETPPFSQRMARTRWLFERFSSLFDSGTVLDIGCYEAPLREYVGAQRYTGVDFAGAPDIELNLESCDTLPFADRAFDTVICIEVLEHLNNLHPLARDLFRVAGAHVLISLPNPWRDVRLKLERGSGQIAHYGLPVEAPKDRHKWFFNATDARIFLDALTPEGWTAEISLSEIRRNPLVKMLRRLRYSPEAYANRYCQTVWAVYHRAQSASSTGSIPQAA